MAQVCDLQNLSLEDVHVDGGKIGWYTEPQGAVAMHWHGYGSAGAVNREER